MKPEFDHYLGEIALDLGGNAPYNPIVVAIEHIENVLGLGEVRQLFLSQPAAPPGQPEGFAIWCLTPYFCCVAADSAQPRDLSVLPLDGRLRRVEFRAEAYTYGARPQDWRQESMLSLGLLFDSGPPEILRATRRNCRYLKEFGRVIVREWLGRSLAR